MACAAARAPFRRKEQPCIMQKLGRRVSRVRPTGILMRTPQRARPRLERGIHSQSCVLEKEAQEVAHLHGVGTTKADSTTRTLMKTL